MFFHAEAYDRYMGRWSRRLAPLFLEFAGVAEGSWVLDLGTGTSSLALTLAAAIPSVEVVGIDASVAYVGYARTRTADPRLQFVAGTAQALPFRHACFDACLASLVINFIPDAHQAVAEMRRVTRPGGKIAACVWDYGEGMVMLRLFWDVAATLDPAAAERYEGRMPYCRSGQLSALWRERGLAHVEETGLTIALEFSSFGDFWSPFLEGQGPAPSYTVGLSSERRYALQERLRAEILSRDRDRPFTLMARAWAVRGTIPPS